MRRYKASYELWVPLMFVIIFGSFFVEFIYQKKYGLALAPGLFMLMNWISFKSKVVIDEIREMRSEEKGGRDDGDNSSD